MKNRRLFRCMGQIDDDLVVEAECSHFKSRKHRLLFELAACLALAGCLGLVIAVPRFLSGQPQDSTAPAEQTQLNTKKDTSADFSFGGLTLDMTQEQVLELLGEPEQVSEEDSPRWFYPSVTVKFHSYDQKVCRIWILKGSTLTLSNGLGIGSSEELLKACYPDLPIMQEYYKAPYLEDAYPQTVQDYTESIHDTQHQIHIGDLTMYIGISQGSIEYFSLLRHSDPMLEALTVDSITIYTPVDGLRIWEPVTVIDKAAKGICTVLTISEPEEPWSEKVGPFYWMDFGNGTALELYGNDHAAIFTYSGEAFDPSCTDGLVWHLSGCFYGLDDYVSRALESPAETWEQE